MSTEQRLRPLNYLEHILKSVRLARGYIEGLDRTEFLEDLKTQQAVILNILIIGEAAIQLAHEDPDFVASYPQIPWKQMRGMRNRLAHGYFDINLDIVWDTVHQSLPMLEQQIHDLLQSLERPIGGPSE